MPIYEFSCNQCGERFEKLVLRQGQKILCPGCSGEQVQKLISACNFGSSDGTVQAASNTSSCSSCTASSCASCSSGGGSG